MCSVGVLCKTGTMKLKAFELYPSVENGCDHFQVFKIWEWTAERLLYVQLHLMVNSAEDDLGKNGFDGQCV